MLPDLDTARILYPDDQPVSREPPAYYKNEVADAEARLTRQPPADAEQEPDRAETLYDEAEQAGAFDAAPISAFFDQQALLANGDGDSERAVELGAASKALVADMRAAGTSSQELGEALKIVNESLADDPALLAAKQDETLAGLERDIGPTFAADLDAARRFIADLDKVAPGTRHSLERSGAGNDPRLIRQAIKEARRRGY